MNNNKNKKFIIWLTGLPCSGKTTIGKELFKIIKSKGLLVKHLDGDIVRSKITNNLGFSKEDRQKNIRIVASLAKQLNIKGYIVITSFISPYREQRKEIRNDNKNFIEVYVNAPLEVCKKRDVKGLYKKACLGEIDNFTGISHCYESPEIPEIELRTDIESVEHSVNKVFDYLIENNVLNYVY